VSERSVLVVLPTLGERLDTLASTLSSVDRQRVDLSLTLVVVVPVEATDARAMALGHGAVLVDDPRLGISHAVNLAVAQAGDEAYYAWIGDDDTFLPGALHTLREAIESDRSAVVAFGACEYVDPGGHTIFTSRAGRLARWLLPWGPDLIPHPGSLIRLDAMRSVGLFDTNLKYALDLDMFLKLRSVGGFVSTRQSVATFGWHPASLTVSNRRASSEEAESVKTRHLPAPLRAVSPLWHAPVRWASSRAARALSRRATG
jgi:GT2 family glycosyltransferase